MTTNALTELLEAALTAHAEVADVPEAQDAGWERLCALRNLVPDLCTQAEQMRTALYLALGGLRAMRADPRLVRLVEDAAAAGIVHVQ